MTNRLKESYCNLKALILKSSSLDELINIPLCSLPNIHQLPLEKDNEILLKYIQAFALIDDIKAYLQRNHHPNQEDVLFKVFSNSNEELICFLCDLYPESLEKLKHFKVLGFYGGYSCSRDTEEDFLLMEAGVKLYSGNMPLEIKTINAGKYKRRGNGSLAIKFLEEYVVPMINNFLSKTGYKENIGYIYGISAELSEDTNALARAKFYSKNGFKMINSHFYKYL